MNKKFKEIIGNENFKKILKTVIIKNSENNNFTDEELDKLVEKSLLLMMEIEVIFMEGMEVTGMVG